MKRSLSYRKAFNAIHTRLTLIPSFGRFHQPSYEQLLLKQVPKAQKDTGDFDCLFALLVSGVNFINILSTAFTLVDPKSVKKV